MHEHLLRFSLAWFLLATVGGASQCQELAEATSKNASEARIGELIGQLGSADYSVREKAQVELGKLGLDAFDALSDAQHHDDIEIALRARFLVRSMQVKWHDEGDSPDVVRLLRGYGDLGELDRKSRIDLLRTLPDREGVNALCRLARYEISDELSKQAALHVLAQPPIVDADLRRAAAQRIARIAGTGKRTGAAWLRTYAQTLEDADASLAEWDAHAKAEHELLTHSPERTSREIVRDLYRWQVALLQQSHHADEAVAVIRQSLSLVDGTPEQLAEVVDWLIHRQAWNVVEEVVERFPQAFAENPSLLYLRAEAFLKQQQLDKAEQFAKEALEAQSEKLDDHRLAALELQKRGLFDWAERELRTIITRATPGAEEDFRARYALAEMLHDIGKELGAAEALQGYLDVVDKDMAARDRGFNLNSLRSRLNYFYSLHYLEQGDVDKATDHLDRGAGFDPTDADVLIGLHRLPNQSEERRKQTLNLISKAAEHFRGQINQYKAFAEQDLEESMKARILEQLATECNQLAWLVGNTTGDFDEALQCSQRSIELMPKHAAYLDTLGRCYFAKGDLDNAVKYQTLALQQEPHSGQMRRQLALFTKERDAKRAAAPKPDEPKP